MTTNGNNANHNHGGSTMNAKTYMTILSTGIGTAAAATIDILGTRAKVTVSLKRAKHFSFHACKKMIEDKTPPTIEALKNAGMAAGRAAVEEAKTAAFNADAKGMFDDLDVL